MNEQNPPRRCRIVLIAPGQRTAPESRALVEAALAGGDVASVILPQYGMGEVEFQAVADAVVPVVQEAGAAAIVAGDSRIAGRVKADGIHVDGPAAALADVIDRMQARMAVGAGGATTRDDALALGELGPDYVFFGRFGYDNKPEPHRRNLALGSWWAEMIQLPCIVLAGSSIESVVAVALTGADFVALGNAVFKSDAPGAAVARANALLDETAPRFED